MTFMKSLGKSVHRLSRPSVIWEAERALARSKLCRQSTFQKMLLSSAALWAWRYAPIIADLACLDELRGAGRAAERRQSHRQ